MVLLNRQVGVVLGLLCWSISAAGWTIDYYTNDVCDVGGLGFDGPEGDDTCVVLGGASSWKVGAAAGCKFRSWSAANCEGSSTAWTLGTDCQPYPFAAIEASCSS